MEDELVNDLAKLIEGLRVPASLGNLPGPAKEALDRICDRFKIGGFFDFTVAGWFKMDSKPPLPTNPAVVAKYERPTDMGYEVHYTGDDFMVFSHFNGSSNGCDVAHPSGLGDTEFTFQVPANVPCFVHRCCNAPVGVVIELTPSSGRR